MDLKETIKKIVESKINQNNKGEVYYKKEIKQSNNAKYDTVKKINKFSF